MQLATPARENSTKAMPQKGHCSVLKQASHRLKVAYVPGCESAVIPGCRGDLSIKQVLEKSSPLGLLCRTLECMPHRSPHICLAERRHHEKDGHCFFPDSGPITLPSQELPCYHEWPTGRWPTPLHRFNRVRRGGPRRIGAVAPLSPTVVLTAGHCTDGTSAARAWFDEVVQGNLQYPFSGDIL